MAHNAIAVSVLKIYSLDSTGMNAQKWGKLGEDFDSSTVALRKKIVFWNNISLVVRHCDSHDFIQKIFRKI